MTLAATERFVYGERELQHLKERDPILGRAIERLGRPERPVMPDVFTALVYAIVGQLISVKTADAIWGRMIERLGDMSPTNLASHSVFDIKSCGLTKNKAEAVHSLSVKIAGGEFSLEELRSLSDEEVIARLSALKGIGKWTAEMVLIHGLHREDVVSYGDAAIRKGMMRLYGLSELSVEDFQPYKARYTPHGTVASIYLWAVSSSSNFDFMGNPPR